MPLDILRNGPILHLENSHTMYIRTPLIVYALAALVDWGLTTFALTLDGVYETNPYMVLPTSNPWVFLAVKLAVVAVIAATVLGLERARTGIADLDAAIRVVTRIATAITLWLLAVGQIWVCAGNIYTLSVVL